MRRRGELRLIERAIGRGWDIPAAELQRARELVAEVLRDPSATTRERIAAARVSRAFAERVDSITHNGTMTT